MNGKKAKAIRRMAKHLLPPDIANSMLPDARADLEKHIVKKVKKELKEK